jgi:NAD(P)-dependent dehydrogenase (short-subunit alcohol dehydrogenase family)
MMTPIVNYHSKTVVVTGAATGVGAALAMLLREAGAARVVALDLKDCGDAVDDTVLVDLADPLAIDEAVAALPESIDVLFNNAGVADTLPTELVMSVNLLAPRKLIGLLRHRIPSGGAVVNTASTAGGGYLDHLTDIQALLAIEDWNEALVWLRGRPDLTQNAYGFSKECSQVLTLTLARDLTQRGIRINSVCPGIIDTPLLDDFIATMGRPILEWMVSQSGGRRATPTEVASVLAFLGSDAASYVSGCNMLVDRGFSAGVITNQLDFAALPTLGTQTNGSAS